MPSLGALVDEVIGTLHGHVDVPAMGTLTADITPTSTSMSIDFGDSPGAARPNGIVEIGTELLVVSRFNASDNTATLTPWGRGHRGTQAAAHKAGSLVTVRPRYPRKRVIDTLNEVVRASCPPLYAARDLEPIQVGPYVGLGYDLPYDTVRVLRVDSTDTAAQMWFDRQLVRTWDVRTVAGTQQLILDGCQAYQTVQVTIAAEPGRLVNDSDDFAITTGLPESCSDLVMLGAIGRLVLGNELARTQLMTVEANDRADKVPSTSATQVSRYYQALYTSRLQQEQDRLNALYPMTILRRG